MKSPVIDAAINQIVDEISQRQEALKVLRRIAGYDVAETEPIHKPWRQVKPKSSRKPKTSAPAPEPGVIRSDIKPEKPDTVVGAVKLLLRDEADAFTRELLEENLREDPDIAKLLDTEAGSRAIGNALYQWTGIGRLKKNGDEYTVTAAGKEWFNK